MDPTTFDRLSQTLGAAGSRRAALHMLAATALAIVMPASRRAAAQGDCPPQTKLCGGSCCSLDHTCCPGETICCAPGLKCCDNGVTCVNPDTHICCDAPCLSGGCPSGSTCCCRPDGLSGGCCKEGEVCQEQPVGPPVCVLPPCPDGRSRCGGVCCGDGQDCQFAQCVDACPPDLTTARQRRDGVTAEATCPLCPDGESPCGTGCCPEARECCNGQCCLLASDVCCQGKCANACCDGVACDRQESCTKFKRPSGAISEKCCFVGDICGGICRDDLASFGKKCCEKEGGVGRFTCPANKRCCHPPRGNAGDCCGRREKCLPTGKCKRKR